jgi:transposase
MARAVGVGRTTIQGFLKKAAQAQLTWPLPPELNDEQLEKLLFPSDPLKFEKSVSRPLPDFLYLHKEFKKKGVTLQLLWEEYQQANPQGYQYTQFRVRCHWASTLTPSGQNFDPPNWELLALPI